MMNVTSSRDPASKVWTAIFVVIVVAIIDWFAVIIPDEVNEGWWTAALIFVALPPLAWIIGDLRDRNFDGVFMWSVVLAFLICTQFVLLKWAQA